MKQFGKQKPRYSFFYNKYEWFRASKCMQCEKLTAHRKFPFLIHFEEMNLVTFGLTSRYCSKCEFIVLHKKDVDGEFTFRFGEVSENLFIIGTVDRKIWKSGLEGNQPNLQEVIANTADFKKVLDYEMQPAGWYFEG